MTAVHGAQRPPTFVFDFDGVVCDSTDECMVTAWNAWERWSYGDKFRRALSEFSDSERSGFRANRPRVRGAGEYYILGRANAEGIRISDQVRYDALGAEWQQHFAKFKDVFYEMRQRLRDEDLESWIALHPVYADVIEVMTRLAGEQRLFVATLKDSESVRIILGKHGVPLPPDRLLDHAQIESKAAALAIIRQRLHCDKKHLFFIDDNVTHLQEPLENGFPVFLSGWGDALPEYTELARQLEIPVLRLDRVQLLDRMSAAELEAIR